MAESASLQRLLLKTATLGPVGSLPAPGTAASALVCAAYVFLPPTPAVCWFFAAVLASALALACVPAAVRALKTPDPGAVVIDEVAGQLLALAPCQGDWKSALLSFALFRILDILKPWGIRRIEKLPGAFGVLLDDVAAGLLAGLVMYVARRFLPGI